MKGSGYSRQLTGMLLVVLAAAFYHRFSWFGLPEKTSAGSLDSHALSFFLAGCTLLILRLPRGVRLPALLFLWLPLTLLAPVNWWHYAFYKDILVFSSFFYGASALEGAKALSGLGNIWPAIGGVALLAGLLAGAYLVTADTKPRKYNAIVAVVFFAFSGVKWAGFADEQDRDIPVVGSAPAMAMVRSFLPASPDIRKHHADAVHVVRPDLARAALSGLFPLYRSGGPDSSASTVEDRKNVIVILLESMRSSETGLHGGSALTPNLDRISRESLYVTDFYSTTTQTVRAETATLCGVLDFNRGAPFSHFEKTMRTWCLPEILADAGYQTHWFHGYKRDFFDRDTFLPDIGFQNIHDEAVISGRNPAAQRLGWGIADESVMRYAMAELEKLEGPFFAEILTLSNHYPFDWDWDSVGYAGFGGLEPSLYGNYQKGIKYTDYALGVFWDAFRRSKLATNTAVFILGDHGVWVFDEQKHASLSLFGRYEQFYRVPFLAWFPDGRRGEIDRVASQVDIAPSILSWLGISSPSAFLGVDVLAADDSREEPFAVMTQNGRTSVRQGSVHCYPAALACASGSMNAHLHCLGGHQMTSGLSCAIPRTAKDMLFATEEDYEEVHRDTSWVDDLSDYMDTALMVGFVPELASTSLREQAAEVREEVVR